MSLYIVWLVLAFIILGVEMLVGSIYLLALFVGGLCGSLIAFLDGSLTLQASACAIVSIAGVIVAFYFKLKYRCKDKKATNNLDKGNQVFVDIVNPDGSALVKYRGAMWTAFDKDNQKLESGYYLIDRIDGTRLLLEKINHK